MPVPPLPPVVTEMSSDLVSCLLGDTITPAESCDVDGLQCELLESFQIFHDKEWAREYS